MSWSNVRYNFYKKEVEENIQNDSINPFEYMLEYMECIEKENYEKSKAITDVLFTLGYDTSQTHRKIKRLN